MGNLGKGIITSYGWGFVKEKTNLHHGRFIFRHKGKKKKGKPNYPPTKLIVKTARKWRRPMRGFRKIWNAEERSHRSMDGRPHRMVRITRTLGAGPQGSAE